MKRITILLPLVNCSGAVITYLYFYLIIDVNRHDPSVPAYYSPLFFLIGTLFLVVAFTLTTRKSLKGLFDVASGKTAFQSLADFEAYPLQREALRFPLVASLISFAVWILAGFIFGLLEPLITGKLFDVETPDLVFGLTRFFGIAFFGGGVTTLVLYFALENEWRKRIPAFFPEGHLDQVKDGFRLSIRNRFLIVFFGIILTPLPVLSITLYSRVMAMHTADAITRTRIMTSLAGELAFIVCDAMVVCILLAYFLSKSISEPLSNIRRAINAVADSDLNTRVKILSNDELGEVAEGFNRMIVNMQENQRLKDSFGKFVSQEIRDEILAGKTSLDGEMKRVTLLFSDLRNFTSMVEKHHPKQVVTIMNQYFNEMTLAINANKGLILQYVGDEIEAVFGAPIDFDDHPDRAVKTALEMRRRLGALNKRLEHQGFAPLSHGIGIHSGAVLAGNIGSQERMSYALVGDTVNSASRIEGLTRQYDCDIIISQTTLNLLTESYPTTQLAAVKVKGKEDELIINKLL
ncbi:MAG: adenylate/guanylate cyclase domain-containing protein [Desulfobacterales bacterium]